MYNSFLGFALKVINNDEIEENANYVNTENLPKEYTVKMALENGDVINRHGNITKLKLLDDFVESVNNKKATLRILSYTDKEDPIIYTLNYDGKIITLHNDRSREKDIIKKHAHQYSEYKKIKRKNSGNAFIVYTLSNGAGKKVFDVLWIPMKGLEKNPEIQKNKTMV